MAVSLYITFFILFHLVLVHSVSAQEENNIQYSCPKSFHCRGLEPMSFPLSNSTYSQCGLCTVTCDEHDPQSHPRIRLGINEGPWYEVIGIKSQADSIQVQIHDQALKSRLDDRSCDAFNSLSFPNSPSISFTISPNLTLFKCHKSFEFSTRTHDNFKDLCNYTMCHDHNLYYQHPHDQYSTPPADLLSHCSVIQLPMKSPDMDHDVSDPFNVLADTFFLELHVSEDCQKCHQRGGQCQNDSQNFRCLAKEGSNSNLKIKVVIGIAATGMAITITLFCYFTRKCLSNKFSIFGKLVTEDNQNVETFLKNFGSLAPKRYSYSEVKKITNSFKDRLGQGGFGSVYKGKLPNGHLVAVKVLKESKGNGEEFVNEVASISRTSHVNIVTLLGFCFEGHKRALIYEFVPNGSLEKFIYERSSSTERQLGWETLYKVAVGIARGLGYLHLGCKTRILHFDIKPHNILLDEDFCPKISDFGLAKLCLKKESIISMLGTRGTAGYIAPEVFCRNYGGVSYKSDVYSYGMMILEMVGGRKNIDVGVDHTSEIYFPHWIYRRLEPNEEIGLHGITNEEENERSRKMIIVGLWCIQSDPSSRPSMNRVVEMLEGSLESLQIPPKPFLSSPPRAPADSTAK